MNMRRFLFIFWSLILSTSTFSQVLFEGTVNENLLKGRVKQIEEFIARFNNEEDWEGKKGNICTDTLYRKKYIRTLFDQSCYRQANGELIPLAEKFIHEVVKNNYQIHFTDSTWSAQVGTFFFQGKCNPKDWVGHERLCIEEFQVAFKSRSSFFF